MCGAVRYRVSGPMSREGAGYCHCRMCQRSTGAPVVAWASFPAEAFAFTAGDPVAYRSSAEAIRRFCGCCGTQLTFAYLEGPPFLDIAIATLDDPRAVPPQFHLWTASRIPWLKLGDDLPAFDGHGADFRPTGGMAAGPQSSSANAPLLPGTDPD